MPRFVLHVFVLAALSLAPLQSLLAEEAAPVPILQPAAAPEGTLTPEVTLTTEPAASDTAASTTSPLFEFTDPASEAAADGTSFVASPAMTDAIAPAPIGCSLNTVTFTNSAAIALPDPGTITATLTVSGMSGPIWDINLITNLAHTNTEDLDIRLISPTGAVSTISTDNGLTRDNLFNGTTWDDQATIEVTDFFPVSDTPFTPFVPEEAMAAFIGDSANGTWKLQIFDDTDNGSGGQHGGWSLEITTLPVYPQPTTETYRDGIDVSLVDDGTLVRTLNVTGAGTTAGEIRLLTEISHSRNNDLDIFLVSPTGITITLSTDNGGTFSGGFGSVTWWDQAGAHSQNGPVSDDVFVNGSSTSPKVPEGALAAYNGLNPNGVWKLLVSDDQPTNTGTLDEWAVEVTSFDCRPDLTVQESSVATYASAGVPLTYSVNVKNIGGHSAANVTVAFEVIAGGTLAAAPSPGGWTCSTPGGSTTKFQCTGSSMAGGLASVFDVYVNPGATPHPVTTLITATTSSTEPTLDNNTAARFTYVGLKSANGNPVDVGDKNFVQDSGAIIDGGQDAFDTWGGLRLRVRNQAAAILVDNVVISGYDLTYDGSRRWKNTAAPIHGGVALSRLIWAPATANWVRYVDLFSNTTANNRLVEVAWGGNLGSDTLTTVAGTSTGDTNLTSTDTWVVTIASEGFDTNGPALVPPVGQLIGSGQVDNYNGPRDWLNGPFTLDWGGNGDPNLGHHYSFLIPPHTAHAIAYFLYRGLAEGVPGPADCTNNCVTPSSGSQIAQAQSVLIALYDNPPLCDLPTQVLEAIINWPEADECKRVYVPLVTR